jgi:ssDNA-binding Zn-finger/Zn-ribbon topoisomerase 1
VTKAQEHVAQGLCSACNEPVEPGHSYCKRHLEENKRLARISKEKRLAQGRCKTCGRPLMDYDGVNKHCMLCSGNTKKEGSFTWN